MKTFATSPFVCVLLAGLLAQPAPALAAESYDSCSGFIDSLPATITTQGVWCLRKDLSTAMTSGNAITIASNNVTIDCNDFKIGGLAAGETSTAFGIFAGNRQNATVRHCAIRGFFYGMQVTGAGHLVEDNRLDQILYMGMQVAGQNNRVRRNAIYDTGGRPTMANAYGIFASADVIDNTVAGVFGTTINTFPIGIYVFGTGGGGNEVRGNRVRDLAVAGAGYANGIYLENPGAKLADNHVSATAMTSGAGIYAPSTQTFCTNNTVVNFVTAYQGCNHSLGNLSSP